MCFVQDHLDLLIDWRDAFLRVDVVYQVLQWAGVGVVVGIPSISKACVQKIQDVRECCFNVADFTLKKNGKKAIEIH